MKVLYLDPGLRGSGHHPVRCRLITGEFRARGIETRVFGHVDIDPGVKAELDAEPHFHHLTYWQSDGDPVCGWLSGFDRFAQVTFDDLMRLEAAPMDLVYLCTAFPVELAAITAWMARQAPEALPSVVVDFSVPSGIRLEHTGTEVKIVLPDPRQNARPVLYRFASKRIAPHVLPRLRLITFEPTTAAHYAQLLERRVDTLPMVYEATTERRNRVDKRPIVVALLGQQQRPKGYHMAPEIVRLLLAQRPELHFLIHNADPDAANTDDPTGLVEAQQLLREIAAADERVQLSEEQAGKELWSSLLERSDLVLCPYLAEHYIGSFSAVAVEAIANGIPIVGPAGTVIEGLINEFDGAGTVFEQQEPSAIAAAAVRLIDDFDHYAALAHKAATIWPTRYGPRALVDALLAQLVPVEVKEQPEHPPKLVSPDGITMTSSSGRMEIIVDRGHRIVVGSDVDTAALRRVLDALEQR